MQQNLFDNALQAAWNAASDHDRREFVANNGADIRSYMDGSGYTAAFERFWDVFPRVRRNKKADALKAWTDAIKAGADPDTIIAAANLFRRSKEGNSKVCPGPGPWLRAKRWEDDASVWNSPAFDDCQIEEPRENLRTEAKHRVAKRKQRIHAEDLEALQSWPEGSPQRAAILRRLGQ